MNLPRETFPGRFTPVAAPSATQTGTTSVGSAVVTGLSSTALISGAVGVTGTGVPLGAMVLSVDSATQITLTANATAAGSASLAFALEPVTLAEAKAHLRINFPDDDAYIGALITVARLRAEADIARAFVTQTWDYTLERFPMATGDYAIWRNVQNAIVIPKAALVSVTSIAYTDMAGTTQTLTEGTDFKVSPGSPGAVYPLPLSRVWPYPRAQFDAVVIRGVYGYGLASAVPATVKQAVLMLVSHFYMNREPINTGSIASVELPMGLTYLLAAEHWGDRF